MSGGTQSDHVRHDAPWLSLEIFEGEEVHGQFGLPELALVIPQIHPRSDREVERSVDLTCFQVVRHRADDVALCGEPIGGATMQRALSYAVRIVGA